MEQSPHSQVAAAIYNCKGGDEFVQERKGLSFGVRKVCEPYYGDEEDGEEYTGLDLTQKMTTTRIFRRRRRHGTVSLEMHGLKS
jgi:hypothetical protein